MISFAEQDCDKNSFRIVTGVLHRMYKERLSSSWTFDVNRINRMNTWTLSRLRLSNVCLRCTSSLSILAALGCNPSSHSEPVTQAKLRVSEPLDASPDPLRELDRAIAEHRWDDAWESAGLVLVNRHDDPSTMLKVARVAFETKRTDAAIGLLFDANRIQNFVNAKHVQQATIAIFAAGRLQEGLELLKEAIAVQPEQHETRRWLFDFLISIEDRAAAIPHGRHLVRARHFDSKLLSMLVSTESRPPEAPSLETFLQRYPDDKRPMIAQAREKYDSKLFDESITMLSTILEAHPENLTAQWMLGRALAATGQFDQIPKWHQSLAGNYQSDTRYWLTLGDWSRLHHQNAQAARSYWEAAKQDPDHLEVWTKLTSVLNLLRSENIAIPKDLFEAAEARTRHLSRFRQAKERFMWTGRSSRAAAIEMAETLIELGRIWEAEAWASIAMTLPQDASVPVKNVRQSIVARLQADTPWQISDGHPELTYSLADFPLPEIVESVVDANIRIAGSSSSTAPTGTDVDAVASTSFRLSNKATKLGIRFFGRTGDDLQTAGIQIYKTLGCGGGTLDFDLDGWPDLYLTAAGGTPPNNDSDFGALIRNLSGTFQDVTDHSSTGDRSFGQGVAIGDLNEDGFPDLFLTNYGPNRLLINHGDGTFGTARAGTLQETLAKWSTSAAIADLNNDGLSDLMVVNYCAGFDPVTRLCVAEESSSEIRACAPVTFAGESDDVWMGTDTGVLRDMTDAWNMNPTILGRGLGLTVGQFDGHAGLDVLVANDMTANHFWTGVSSPSFQLVESAISRGLAGDGASLSQGSMGIATDDFDHDGDIDFYVTNFNTEYNTFYEQSAPGIWQDQTTPLGLATPTLSLVGFGTQSIDIDNDGTRELIVSNGHVDIFTNSRRPSAYAQPMQVFRKNSRGRFDSIAHAIPSDYFQSEHVGRSLWLTDVNRDGMADVVVTHQTEPVALLVNETETKNHFIEFRLIGTKSARDAIGAIIGIRSGSNHSVFPLTAGDGYQCSNERIVRFGLGMNLSSVHVTVKWPDDSEEEFPGLAPDTQWLIVQGGHATELPMPNSR